MTSMTYFNFLKIATYWEVFSEKKQKVSGEILPWFMIDDSACEYKTRNIFHILNHYL